MKNKMLIYVVLAFVFVGVLIVGACEFAIASACEGRIYDRAEGVPHHEVCLLLGTGPVSVFGGVNPYYTSRIATTVELVKLHKIDRVLISGDNKGPEYNEPQIMRDSLVAHGVPESIIVMDGKGKNTQASIDNAVRLFHLKKFVIISQEFHNQRALYMASHASLDATAVNAGENYYGGIRMVRMWLRERLSRVKAVFSHLFN